MTMYFSWLDRWDERRTRRRDGVKKVTDLAFDPGLVFPVNDDAGSLDAFCAAAELAALASDRFFGVPDPIEEVRADADWIRFRSSMPTGVFENDVVHAKLTRGKTFGHAAIVFHHWNASSRNRAMAGFLSRKGITVAEIAMPYHLERSRPGSSHADYMLSPNLGRTLQSVRQAVIDGRQLVRILQQAGYQRVSVLGTSLGSWVAGLVAAHDPSVGKASLLLSAGSLAEMVWTGAATRHIRTSLEVQMELADLRRAWAPLDLGNHVAKLARPGLDVQIVLAKRDKVVQPAVSEDFVRAMQDAGASLHVKRFNCGHYSLTLPPYAISTGINVARFLKGTVTGLRRDASQLNPA